MLVVEVEVESRRFAVVGLGGVIVKAQHRGRGLARQVVQTALARAQTLGPEFALLFCLEDRAGLVLRSLRPDVLAGQYAAAVLANSKRRRRFRTDARGRAGTYSIVARDPATGELGVAVQSHWFSVGPLVPWAMAGVGAVATQANVEASYGPRALELLQQDTPAEEALGQLLAQDEGRQGRQVAVVDARGRVAAHTGEACMRFAGHVVGRQVSCQANIMAGETVWPSMLQAFEAAAGTLTERLLDALDSAEAAGGDIRGRQSAAILVVPASGEPWESVVSLRVEDHPEPLRELRRLVALHDAYVLAGEGDALINEERYDEAAVLYQRAADLAPGNHELRFWSGLGAAQVGNLDDGVRQVREAIAAQPGWAELLERLPADLFPAAAIVLRRLRGWA